MQKIQAARIWLWGPPGAGKTYMADWLGQAVDGIVVHVGQKLRDEHGVEMMLKSANQLAVPELEPQVRAIISQSIAMADEMKKPLIIDSVKSASQLSYIPGDDDVLVFVRAGDELRRKRLMDRCKTPQDWDLAVKADFTFKATENEFRAEARALGISIVELPNEEEKI